MKKFYIPLLIMFFLFSCEQEIAPPTISYAVNNVEATPGFTTCTIHCENESVDGDKIKMRVMVADEESMQSAVPFVMNLSSGGLGCDVYELLPDHQYYYCFEIFTTNDFYRMDEIYQFRTKAYSAPSVSTLNASDITYSSAVCGGEVTNAGGQEITERGILWNIGNTLLNDCNKTIIGSGLGQYSILLDNLEQNTTYCFKAYAINSLDTAYGEVKSFLTSTNTQMNVTTNTVTNIQPTSASCGGMVTTTGSTSVTSRGVCYATTRVPTISQQHTTDGSGTGSFVSQLSSLQRGTTYYARAYAVNGIGVEYGNEVQFTTLSELPTVTTNGVTNITSSSATVVGNVIDDGGTTVSRGICWSTTETPTLSNNYMYMGSGTGVFSVEMSGLISGVTYYVRAFATNSVGTAYGVIYYFTTLVDVPIISTKEVTEITQTTAKSGGMVQNTGSSSIINYGICWSTNHNPTLSNSQTTNGGNGYGNYTSYLTGLSSGVTYYVRAFATNDSGTGYGNEVSFSTQNVSISEVTAERYGGSGTLAHFTATVSGASISGRGFVWSHTYSSPTVGGADCSWQNQGSGSGTFDGYYPVYSTTGYVRAYVTVGSTYYYGPVTTF